MNKEKIFNPVKTYDSSYETSGKGKTRKKKNKQLFTNLLETISGMSEEEIAETMRESRKPWGDNKANRNGDGILEKLKEKLKRKGKNSEQEPSYQVTFKSGFLFNRPDLLKIANPILPAQGDQLASGILQGETEIEKTNNSLQLSAMLNDPDLEFSEGTFNAGFTLIEKGLNFLYNNFENIEGFGPLQYTPIYTPELSKAVKYFQNQNRIEENGKINGSFVRLLDNAIVTKLNQELNIDITSKYANSADNVYIKKSLNYLFSKSISEIRGPLLLTPVFDSELKSAIKIFQTKNSEIERKDGVIDSITLRILDKKLLEKQSKEFGPLVDESLEAFTESANFGGNNTATLDPTFWKKIGFISFQIRIGVTPSKAMDAVFSDKSTLDCRAAVEVAIIQSIRNYLTDDIFNQIYKREKKRDLGLVITGSKNMKILSKSTALRNLITVEGIKGLEDLISGDWLFYGNDPRYPGGNYERENLVFKGKDQNDIYRFSGHGMGTDLTIYDIYLKMREQYLLETAPEGDKQKTIEKNLKDVNEMLSKEGKSINSNYVPDNDPGFHPQGFEWNAVSRVSIMSLEESQNKSPK
jgi:hypothetical protein